MASNNQRAPSVPLPSRWSKDGKKNTKEHEETVLNQVREMFGTILEQDIILSVVQNCKWELQPSIEALIMLSENAESPFKNCSENLDSDSFDEDNDGIKKFEGNDIMKSCERINIDDNELKSDIDESISGYLNFNDKEILRQKNEFRKFEMLKKDLNDKGFVSSFNENVTKTSYVNEIDKIPLPKLQQYNQSWKNDFSKIYYCSEVENSANNQSGITGQSINSTVNQLWDKDDDNNSRDNTEMKKTKETNNQFDNFFGSKLQFSRDISPKNLKINVGTIPKNNRTQIIDGSSSSSSSSSQWLDKNHSQEDNNTKSNTYCSKLSNADSSYGLNSSYNINHTINIPTTTQESSSSSNSTSTLSNCSNSNSSLSKNQQQVSQFDSNYDNETKTRTTIKSNVHKNDTESLCGLKVQYRLPGLENSSDDDADVVIEEERPDYPTQIPSLLSTSVCHFISSSTSPGCSGSPTKKSRPESSLTDSSPSPESSSSSPQHNTYDNKLKNIISSIIKGYKVFIILRGLPGSGKSHLATNVIKSTVGGDERQFVFSTDDYFSHGNKGGVYNYSKTKLSDAHSWNQKRVLNALKEGISPVILSNTNTQAWEMQRYVLMGVQNGYIVEILEPSTPWSKNLNELVRKNIHGVPKEKIRNMIERYEHNLTGEKLIEQMGLKYSPDNLPPQYRKYPPLEGIQKIDKQQKPSKRNRRRKKNQQTIDPINCQQQQQQQQQQEEQQEPQQQQEQEKLISESEKTLKHESESNYLLKTGNDTLDEIVSNALMSENESLNKSLVDYCIETDSEDEIDSDRGPRTVSDNQQRVDLFGENINDDNDEIKFSNEKEFPSSSATSSSPSSSSSSCGSSSAAIVTENNEDKRPLVPLDNGENDDENCSNKKLNVFDIEGNENGSESCRHHHNHHHHQQQNQNLGAIGSERRESGPTIDYKNMPRTNCDEIELEKDDNSLSQCWDFTLIIGDRKIHSVYGDKSKTVVDRPLKKFDDNIDNCDNNCIKSDDSEDYKSGVIITEITEETEIELRKGGFVNCGNESFAKDSDSMMDNITKKINEIEVVVKNLDEHVSRIKTDFETDIDYTEPNAGSESPRIVNEVKDSSNDVKDSLKKRESTMKYRHQTNDNSLSENDAFENEMSHREPSLVLTGIEIAEDGSLDLSGSKIASSTIDDSLSDKLSASNNGELFVSTSFIDGNLCQVSEPVTFDTLVVESDLECRLVDDTLSNKLSDESFRETKLSGVLKKRIKSELENRTRSLCVNSSLESVINNQENNGSDAITKSHSEIDTEKYSDRDNEKSVDKNLLKENLDNDYLLKVSSGIDEKDLKTDEVHSIVEISSTIKKEDLKEVDLTKKEDRDNESKKTVEEYEKVISKDEKMSENSEIKISNDPIAESSELNKEVDSELSEKNENCDNKESSNEIMADKNSKVKPRYALKTVLIDGVETAVLVTVEKGETDSLASDSDGESSMAVCCEGCDENGCIYSETSETELDSKPCEEEEEEEVEDDEDNDNDDGFVEYKTSDDSGVDNSGDRDKKRDVTEGGEDTVNEETAVEIVDNINRVTWKESPFPVAPNNLISEAVNDKEKVNSVEKSDSSTNTSNYDFNVLYVGGTSEYKILSTNSRTINFGVGSSVRSCEEKPPLKLMLDKSSMTSVVNILSGDESGLDSKTEVEALKDIDELTEMFPNVSREDITEIYRTLCSGNFDWAVEVLLDGVPDDAVTKYAKIEPPRIVLEKRNSPPAGVSESSDFQSQSSTPHKERFEKIVKQGSSSLESSENTADTKLNSSPKKKKEKYKISEEKLELKRQIEEKMIISEASYNPHILKVKRWKNGEPDLPPNDDSNLNESQNQNKHFIEFSQRFEKSEDDNSEIPDDKNSPKSSESIDDLTEDDLEPEEMIELNLGEEFIKNLETNFGDPNFTFPDGLFPVIQIKQSMAQQIHALWIESMEQQMNAQQEQLDKMIEKDAEYARSLEQEEARNVTEPIVPNLSEIMDMDMALAIYKNDLKRQLKLETPNDMASRLTRQMLHEMFTDHDPETLDEILNAHNGNFKETVEVLEASTGKIVDRNSTLNKKKILIDNAKKELIRSNEEECDRSSLGASSEIVKPSISDSILTYDDAMEEAMASRREAQRQLFLRNENFQKATEAIRKGSPEVAGYYSEIAKLHKKKMERANSTAASAFLAAQDYKMNAENTLDLHYLYVAEALQALDVFLDYHISRLNQGNKKSINLYIITGRGARSNGGQSRIKPAVSKKLASKNLRYMQENPGCLKVVIHRRN